jgi:steroid-22-oyl-CoA synthetase
MTTTADLLRARAADQHTGLLFEDERYSWAEIVQHGARRATLALAERGPGPFHIGVLLDNEPEYVFWIAGAALAGAAVVGINPTRRGAELAHDIAHTDCQMIVTDTAHRHVLDGLDTGVAPERILCIDAADYPARIEAHAADRLPTHVDPSTPLLLLFTSGSTGAPKAVVCSQGRFTSISQRMPSSFGLTVDDVCYNAMPMFHGNALMACWSPTLTTGGAWALRRSFSASGFLPDVRRFGATYINYVGRSLAYILATPEQPDDADNPVRLAFGTEASDRDLTEFTRRFGCRFAEGYGSSEGLITISKTPEAPPTALGLAPADIDVIVADPDTGEECPRASFGAHGQLQNLAAIGELVRRNPGDQFEGYYNNASADAERLRGGWYWSGDLAYRDADGYLYFAGRGNDWLRVDSENFAAAPIERIIARFPGVLVDAVYPVPDSRTGDQVMVAIELEPGAAFDVAAFDRFLGDQPDLGTKWSPRFVRIVERMPLTGSNKIDKKPLRVIRWDGPDLVWWRPAKGRPLQRMTDDDRANIDDEFRRNGRSGLSP